MRIAVASQNFTTISADAGKARRWLVYEVLPGHDPKEVDRLDLPKELAMHEFSGDGAHPLDDMTALVAASAGDGFTDRMAARGVMVAVTETETDPIEAAAEVALALTEAMAYAVRRLEERDNCYRARPDRPGCDGQGGCGCEEDEGCGCDSDNGEGCCGHDHGHDQNRGGCGCGVAALVADAPPPILRKTPESP